MKYYLGDAKVIKQEKITSWLPAFQQKERSWMIRATLAEHIASHPEALETSASRGVQDSSSDAPNVYLSGTPDEDLLETYLEDDSIPDEAAATLIGDAKGRLKHDGVPVPTPHTC